MKIVAVQPTLLPGAVDKAFGTSAMLTSILPGIAAQDIPELRLDTLIAPDHAPLKPIRRLVILVPEGEMDETALARRAWLLASSASLDVLFLGLSPDQENDSDTRRRLAQLAAAVHQGEVRARSSVVIGKSWLQAVEGVLTGGDMLVCVDGYHIPYRLFGRRKLGEALAENFRAPVYLLGDLQIGRSPAFGKLVYALAAWGVSMVILFGFLGLQIWLSQNTSTRLMPFLLAFSVIAEGITLYKIIEWIG